MNFPESVEYSTFYWAAKKKGVKIVSKYAGVNIAFKRGYKLYFYASCMINGKINRGKHHPLNKYGERLAHQEYLALRAKHEQNVGTTVLKKFR